MRLHRAAAGTLFALGSTGAWVVATGGCSTLADVPPGCSNFVVEPNLGEDCDDATADSPRDTGTERPARCAKVGEVGACHFVADATHDCPIGFHAGPSRGACVRGSGVFGTPSARMPNLLGKRPQVLDVDQDGQLDVVLDGIQGDFTAPHFLKRPANDRYEATDGPHESLFAAFVDLSEDGLADVASPAAAAEYSGLVVRLRHLDRSDEARIFEHQSTAGRLRYAWAPRDDSSNDDLVALFEDADGSACGAPVCGCVVGKAKCAGSFAVPWLTADALRELDAVHGRSGLVLAPSAGPIEFAPSATAMAGGKWFTILSSAYLGGITLRDLNGDGVEDVGFLACSTTMRSEDRTFARASGPLSFLAPPVVEVVATHSGCGPTLPGPAFGFIDADATPDLYDGFHVWTSSTGPTTGPLMGPGPVSAPFPDTVLGLGDVNGDGRDDLAIARVEGVSLLLGAEGSPLVEMSYPTPLPTKDVLVSDVDGDGLGDIVAVIGADGVGSCATSLDEVLIAYGRASGHPEPWRSVGRVPGVARISAGRWTHPGSSSPDALADIAIASHCSDGAGGRGAILRGDAGRRPFSVLSLKTDKGAAADINRAIAAPDLATALGLSSAVVVTGRADSGARTAFLLPFTGRADAQPSLRIELPLPPPTKKGGEPVLQAIVGRTDDPGAFIGGLLDSGTGVLGDGGKSDLILFAARAGGELTDRRALRSVEYGGSATWSNASLPKSEGDPGRRFAIVSRYTGGVTVNGPVAPVSAFVLFDVDAGGHFADVVDVPPAESGAFVGVTTYEGAAGEHVLLVATDQSVDRVDPASGALTPFLVDGAPLDVTGVTAIASGDFSGDGLDDVLVIDENGGIIIPQLAKTPAQP